MSKNDITPAQHFVEHMGLLVQADGLPRIAGRIMALIILEGGAFSFGDLATQLEVSRGSISTNTRLLESMGVIERTARPGSRQDYFQLAEDPYTKLLHGSALRMKKAEALVLETQAQCVSDEGAQLRLRELASFYQSMIRAYEKVIIQMKDGDKS